MTFDYLILLVSDNGNIGTSSTTRTRSIRHASSTNSAITRNGRRLQSATNTTSVIQTTSISQHPLAVDHNYGEPGPSSLRQTRRVGMLSRHQRNADELDSHSLVDPLAGLDELDSGTSRIDTPIVSRLRMRNIQTTNTAASSNIASTSLRNRRILPTRNHHANRINYNDSEEDESIVQNDLEEDVEEEQNGGLEDDDDVDDSDSEDDNTPLKIMASSSSNSLRNTRSAVNSSIGLRTNRNRFVTSDDEQVNKSNY